MQEVDAMDPEELRDAAKRLLTDKVDRRAGWGDQGELETASLEGEISALGWSLLTLPVSSGGLGQSFVALAPIYEEMGRSLAPVTLADTMAAVDVLMADGSAVAAQLLDRIASGEAHVVVTFFPIDETHGSELSLVRGAMSATDLLLLPEGGEGQAMIVDLRGAGVAIERVETWDRGRTFGDIRLSRAAAIRALTIEAREAAQLARAHLDLAMAWDCVGGADQSLGEAVAYMGTRQQFGRPIGSFQALKHRAADLKVGLELARALTRKASIVYAERAVGWGDLAGQARLLAVDAYRAIAEEAVQFHGGVGFTWEYDCHLFLKRALMNEMLGGTPEEIRDRVAPGILGRALAPLARNH